MARFGQQIIAGLLQPSYQQGMFTVGQQLGARPRQIAEEKEKRKRLQGLLTGQGPLTQQDISSFIAAGGDVANIPAAQQLRESYDEPLREKGRGRLRATAQMELFDPQDPGQLQGYKNVAERHKVSFNEAMQILAEERGTEIERAKIKSTATGSGDFGFAEGETWVDTQGNYYAQGTRRNKQTGKYETVFDPITPGAPDMPVGKLTPVMPGTMETSEERVGRELETAEGRAQLDITKATTIETAKNFDQQKTKAADRLPTVLDTLDKVDAMLQIVDGLETGSTLAQMSDLVQTALGYRETDMGIFQTAAKELLVGRITSFGSNPSDGERNAIVEMLPNIQNTPND
jgi:hypothetical protein